MKPRLSRRRFLGLIALGGLGVMGSVLAGGYLFGVSRHRFALPGLKAPLRVVHLTDLHVGPYIGERSLKAWVDATLAEMPDLILITGDFVDAQLSHEDRLEPLTRQLARLDAPLGVWGSWGNHDYQRQHNVDSDMTGLERELTRAGVRMLRNEGVRLRDDLFLAGVDDMWYGEPDLATALADHPDGAVCLLMSHNPDLLPSVPKTVGLTLCGHTHGGQVKLPFVGPVVTGSIYGERFVEGWIRQPVNAFVSRGLGFSILPVRFNCPAEVARIDVEPG